MRRSVWFLVAALMLAVALWRPASSQDNYEARIAELETRVSDLEGPVGQFRTLYGNVVLRGAPGLNMSPPGSSCYGAGDYYDLGPDARVTATTDSGQVVLEGWLRPGPVAPYLNPDGSLALSFECAMPFEIWGLEDGKSYTLTFGSGRTLFLDHQRLADARFVVNIPVV